MIEAGIMAVSRLMPQDPRRAAMMTAVVRGLHSLKSSEPLRRTAQLLQQTETSPSLIDRIVPPDSPTAKLALAGAAIGAFGEGGAEFMSVGALMAAGGLGFALNSYACAAMTGFFRESLRGTGKDPAAFARHSVAVSVGAGILASWSGADVTTAKVAGALHNVGLGLLVWSNGKIYGGTSSPIAGTEAQIHDMEADLMGYDHQEAGASFLQQLGFSQDIWQAAATHHKPDANGVALLVRTADMAAHQMGCDLGFANSVVPESQAVFQRLGDAKVGQLAEAVAAVTTNFSRLKD